jgi:hypothetical protein
VIFRRTTTAGGGGAGGGATQEDIDAAVAAAVAALVDSSPASLDTLNELAAALGDDANFAATVTTALAGKQPVDADLTAIAALTTTAFGRSLLEGADAAAVRALISAAPIELGSMFAGIDSRVAFAAQFGSDEGYDEEFDGYNVADDVLPANWSMLNQDASVYRQSFGAGRVDWGGGGDASNLHAAVRALPATTTFDAFFHTWGAADVATASATYVAAIVLYNSANGDFIYCGLHQASGTAAPQFFVSHFSDADTQGSTLATGPVQRLASPHVFFRVTKESDTSYDFFGNTDGGCWFTIGANINVQASLGADPTHIGFALNTVGAGHVGCEWFRVRDLT